MKYEIWYTPDGWWWKRTDGDTGTDDVGPYETTDQAVISLLGYLNDLEVNCG